MIGYEDYFIKDNNIKLKIKLVVYWNKFLGVSM